MGHITGGRGPRCYIDLRQCLLHKETGQAAETQAIEKADPEAVASVLPSLACRARDKPGTAWHGDCSQLVGSL